MSVCFPSSRASVRIRVAAALLAAIVAGAGTALALASDSRAPDPSPIEVFERYFDDRDPKVRRKAVEQLKDAHGPRVVLALVQALGDTDDRVRGAAQKQLRRGPRTDDEIAALHRRRSRERDPGVRREIVRALGAAGPSARESVVSALEDRDGGVRNTAARVLGSLADPLALPALHVALTDRDAAVRASAIESIGAIEQGAATGAASAVLRGDRATGPRVAAALVLAAYPRPEAIEHQIFGLRIPAWPIRVACARGLGAQRGDVVSARAAAGALVIALNAEERVRVAEEMSTALFHLTGIDFGPEPDRWTAWYAEVGTTFEPPERLPRRAHIVPGGTQAGLLDLPTASDHVTFLLDGSHSMNDPVRFGFETTKRNALLDAFERAINRLPARSWANVIAFGTTPVAYKSSLFRASPASRRSAVRFLAKRQPDGRTNIYDSLVLAFEDPQVDTLVLVTDGAPSEGERTTRTGILDGLRDLNRHRLIRVHTVEIGARNTSRRWRGFLRQVAEATGGHYLER